mgnify:CR=1 FL=1
MASNDNKIELNIDAETSNARRKLEELKNYMHGMTEDANKFFKETQSSPTHIFSNDTTAHYTKSSNTVSELMDSLDQLAKKMKSESWDTKLGKTTGNYGEARSLDKTAEKIRRSLNEAQTKTHLTSSGPMNSNSYDINHERKGIRQVRRENTNTVNGIGREIRSNARTINNSAVNGHITNEKYNQIMDNYSQNETLMNHLYSRDSEGNGHGILSETLGNAQSGYETNRSNAQMAQDSGDPVLARQYERTADQYKELENSINDLISTLDKQRDSINEGREKLSSGVKNGTIERELPRGSIGSMLKSRSFAIGFNFVNSVQNGIQSQFSSGSSSRMAMQDNINSITLPNGANGNTTHNADHTLTRDLAHKGINNGTGYDATTMAQFAGTYAQSSGNTNVQQDVSAANYMSQLSRYSGLGTQTTNALFSSLGQAGALSGSGSVGSLTRQFQGMLTNSGTRGIANLQGQALNSVVSNLYGQGQTVSGTEASRLIATQGIMSRYGGKAFQGAAGAQAMNSINNGISSNGYSDPFMRFAWAGSNPRYAGAVGQAQQQLDMNEPYKHPQELSSFIQNYKRTAGAGNDKITAARLMGSLGLSAEQSESLVKMSDNGDLTQSKLQAWEKKNHVSGKSTNRNEKKQFTAQGNSTLDIKVAVQENGQISASESMDGMRRLGNGATKGLPGIVNSGLSTVGTIAGSTLNTALSLAGAKAITGMTTRVFGGSLVGGTLKKASTWMHGKGGILGKTADFMGGLFAGGKGEEAAEGATKGATVAEDVGKAGEDASRAGVFGKVAGWGSKILGGIKGAGALGGIAGLGSKALSFGGKFLGPVGWALAGVQAIQGVGDIAKNPKNALKHPFKSIGSLLGLDTVNGNSSDKASANSSNSSNGSSNTSDKTQNVIDAAQQWLHQFDLELDKAERVIQMAKGININSNKNKSSGRSSSSPKGGKLPEGSSSKSPSKWGTNIKAAAKKMGVNLSKGDISTIEKAIKHESTGSTTAKNPSGATGLLQYKPSTFKNYAVKGHTNIKNGNDQLLALFNDKNWKSDIGKDLTVGSWGPNGAKRKHAFGGIFDSEHMATIAEAGPEAIVPLSPDKRGVANDIMNNIGGVIGNNLSSQARGTTSNSANMNFNPNYQLSVSSNGSTPNEVQSLKAQLSQLMNKLGRDAQDKFARQQANFYGMNVKM